MATGSTIPKGAFLNPLLDPIGVSKKQKKASKTTSSLILSLLYNRTKTIANNIYNNPVNLYGLRNFTGIGTNIIISANIIPTITPIIILVLILVIL